VRWAIFERFVFLHVCSVISTTTRFFEQQHAFGVGDSSAAAPFYIVLIYLSVRTGDFFCIPLGVGTALNSLNCPHILRKHVAFLSKRPYAGVSFPVDLDEGEWVDRRMGVVVAGRAMTLSEDLISLSFSLPSCLSLAHLDLVSCPQQRNVFRRLRGFMAE